MHLRTYLVTFEMHLLINKAVLVGAVCSTSVCQPFLRLMTHIGTALGGGGAGLVMWRVRAAWWGSCSSQPSLSRCSALQPTTSPLSSSLAVYTSVCNPVTNTAATTNRETASQVKHP